MIKKRIQDFIGGLHKTDNKSLVQSNEFVDGKNLIPQEDNSLLKRLGRELISQIVTDQNKITGLIQNETEGGVKQLFAVNVTDIYQNVSGTIWDSKFSGFTDLPFYSKYWQNKCFWGNGQEDMISTLDDLVNLRLYVADTGNNRISIFDKKDPYEFTKIFGEYGAGDGQFINNTKIAVDSTAIYVLDTGNNRVQLFSKDGIWLANIAVSGSSRGLAIDSEWIYVTSDLAIGVGIRVYSKTSPYGFDREVQIGTGLSPIGIAVDEQYTYCRGGTSGGLQDDIYIKDKLTLAAIDNFAVSTGVVSVAVDREEFFTSYIYIGRSDSVTIRNKTSPYAEVGTIAIAATEGMTIDNQYIYLTDPSTHTIKVYNKSMPTPTLIATISQQGTLGGDLSNPKGIIMELIAQNDPTLFIGFLDAPARPLAFWDVTGGNVEAGTYKYRMTFSDGTNETNVSQESQGVVVSAAKGQVWLQLMQTSIPSDITQWVLYRKKDAGDYHQLASVNITDTQYLDDIVESDIVNKSAYPVSSTLHPFLSSNIFTFYQESLWILKGKTLYFSTPFAPNDFPIDNTLGIDTRTDGSGMFGGESGMFIFTKNSTAILEGWNIDNYTYRELSETVGCLSHRSIKEYLKTVIWLDRNGIFISDGTQPIKISEPRIDKLIEAIEIDKVENICAEIFNDKYLLSIPDSSLVIVYDFERKCFYIFDWIIHDFALIEDADDNELLYMGGADSAIYQLFKNNADDDESGTPQDIACEIETKHFDMDAPEILKWFYNLFIIAGCDGSNNATMSFKWKVGDNDEESREIIVSRLKQTNRVRPKGGRGTTLYFKVTETGQQEFKIYGFIANLDVLDKTKIHSQGG